MKKLIFISCMFACIAPANLVAQEHFKCGSDHMMRKVFAAHPELETEHQQLIANSQQVTYNERGEREEVYVIPVVFHVIHEYGVENISDAQIYGQMDILNEDFRKLNADTADIVAPFDTLAADAKIEFRLASIDPFGNCTNGIEHINSHETRMGDDNSKLNQWPRSRYLNIWIVKSMEPGVAGYAYYPSAVSSGLYYADGIIILNQYVGFDGTSDPNSSRALTHEIGHYLALPHTWGSTNDPGVSCGDDGIMDTPVTKGHEVCILTGTDDCNPGVEENIQNFMEYAYCSNMYTKGQVATMQLTLNDIVSSRDNLWSETNHTITGIDVTAPQCAPIPDFHQDKQLVCAGQDVEYYNASWNATVTSFSWHFPGGTPEYSTDVDPVVTYANPGLYDVTLTVTNGAGTNSKTISGCTMVEGDYYDYVGPHSYDFEGSDFEALWVVQNPEYDEHKFKVHEGVGYSGTHAVGVELYKANLDPILDLNYLERLGGAKDILISPIYNLDNTTGGMLEFKYAHATLTSGMFEGEHLNLRVYYTVNCGVTWTLLENIQELDVVTAGYQGTNFFPTNPTYWTHVGVSLPGAAMADQVRFKFEFTAADYSNNFFLDDINVNGVLLNEENTLQVNGVSVYPNPAENGQVVTLSYGLLEADVVNVTLYDMLGNVITTTSFAGVQGSNMSQLDLSDIDLSSGFYTVTVRTETAVQSSKLYIK